LVEIQTIVAPTPMGVVERRGEEEEEEEEEEEGEEEEEEEEEVEGIYMHTHIYTHAQGNALLRLF
jgi:hypothetical protein